LENSQQRLSPLQNGKTFILNLPGNQAWQAVMGSGPFGSKSGDHDHDCRQISGSGAASGTDRNDPYSEECRNHDGEWESGKGD